MSISSMTGFARAEGATDLCTWGWEAKSVNGKGLDIRLRYPRGFDFIDASTRERVTKRFKRGNVSLNLDINWTKSQATVSLNEDVLAQVLEAATAIQDKVPNAQPPSVDGILALRGVLEQSDDEFSAEDAQALEVDLLMGLDQLLDQLSEGRDAEGARMGGVLHDQLAVIESLSEEAANLAAMQPEAIRQRLVDQVAQLVEDVDTLDPDRLAQEAAIVMTKADVREELDRLSAHIAAARDLLAEDEPVGRRLDFLCQEFNREANTLCSKSSDTELTRVGLELKAVIEQFREQVQNIE
ncbi:YicC/YloC family endoribonuclease [Magnetovibrio sp. PR-2]|uniref:YicC/YloC family endoribonuclease n=1 Tax=Magnetovibrio sp. PR-2 TaxID=3120356 RepID=UPI002FCDF2C1